MEKLSFAQFQTLQMSSQKVAKNIEDLENISKFRKLKRRAAIQNELKRLEAIKGPWD